MGHRPRVPGPAASVRARLACEPGSSRVRSARASAAARPTSRSGPSAVLVEVASTVSGSSDRPGAASIRLAKRSWLTPIRRRETATTGNRAPVVRRQLDAPRAGIVRSESRGSGARRPVATHRWSGRHRQPRTGCCSGSARRRTRRSCAASTSWNSSTQTWLKRACQRRAELRHRPRARSAAPTTRSSKSTGAARRPAGRETPRPWRGVGAGGVRPSTFQAETIGVQRRRIGQLGGASARSPTGELARRQCGAQQRQAVGEQPCTGAPRVEQHLPRQGVQRPDLDRARRRARRARGGWRCGRSAPAPRRG